MRDFDELTAGDLHRIIVSDVYRKPIAYENVITQHSIVSLEQLFDCPDNSCIVCELLNYIKELLVNEKRLRERIKDLENLP
jgi:hypothetical protein